MNTIISLYEQAQLAEAAYADFVTNTDAKVALKDEGMSEKQATEFLKQS